MKKDYKNPAVRLRMYEQLSALMEKAEKEIENKRILGLYPLGSHRHLMELGWRLLLPLSKDKWPESFKKIPVNLATAWPNQATVLYFTDDLVSGDIKINQLYFGYAVVSGELRKASFFVTNEPDKSIFCEAAVIDPLCVESGVNPDYYIGCSVEQEDFDNLPLATMSPLERFVDRLRREEHQGRMNDYYDNVYRKQLGCDPGHFPAPLIDFLKEYHLFIPSQSKVKVI